MKSADICSAIAVTALIVFVITLPVTTAAQTVKLNVKDSTGVESSWLRIQGLNQF